MRGDLWTWEGKQDLILLVLMVMHHLTNHQGKDLNTLKMITMRGLEMENIIENLMIEISGREESMIETEGILETMIETEETPETMKETEIEETINMKERIDEIMKEMKEETMTEIHAET